MRRGAWLALLVASALPLAAWLALALGLATPLFNAALSRALKGRSPLEIRAGVFRCDLVHTAEIDDLVVLAPVRDAKLPLLTLDRVRLHYALWDCLRGRLDWQECLTWARLSGLKVFLLRDDTGRWNLPTGASTGATPSASASGSVFGLLPASRVELDSSELVFNDDYKGFRTVIDSVAGSLDTRALPLLAFTLQGRTEGKARTDLSLSGEWNQEEGGLAGRLDVQDVDLARYLNYFLPSGQLKFTDGRASLNVLLRRHGRGALQTSGRASVTEGALRLPGIGEPLSDFKGEVAFGGDALRFKAVEAVFLGSRWSATGAIVGLEHPAYDLEVENAAQPLEYLSQQVRGLQSLGLSGSAQVDARMSGPAASPVVEAQLSAPWMALRGVEFKRVEIRAGYKDERLEVRELQAGLWDGIVSGTARMDFRTKGAIEADLSVLGAAIEHAEISGRRLVPLRGRLSGHASLSGALRSPEFSADFATSDLAISRTALENLNAHAEWGPPGFRAVLASSKGSLLGNLDFTAPAAGTAEFRRSRLTIRGVDLSATAALISAAEDSDVVPASVSGAVAPWRGRLGGKADVEVDVEGPVANPTAWVRLALGQATVAALAPTGSAAVEPLEVRLAGVFGWHAGEFLFGKSGEPFTLGMKSVVHHAGADLQAFGHLPLDAPKTEGHLAVSADLDFRMLGAFPLLSGAQGKASADGVVSGSLKSPKIHGTVKVRGFSCAPSAYVGPVKDGRATLRFEDQSVGVEDISFACGGRVTALGQLDFSEGFAAPKGRLEVSTDDDGLRVEHWNGVGSGSLVLGPLDLDFGGAGGPLGISGRAFLKDALIVYSGQEEETPASSEAGKPSPTASPTPGSAPGRSLDMDLRVGLGANVWYEKHQNRTVDLSDPTRWLSDALASAKETLLMPDISFRMRPTQEDFVVRGGGSNLELVGELVIDRGRMTIMENDFDITSDKGPAVVRFHGQGADISGTAEARLRYTRDDPVTYRTVQKAVEVYVYISPRTQEEIEAAGLEGQFLNFKVDFDSDPQIIPENPDLQRTAVIDLVVLGDPLVDIGDQGVSTSGEASQGALIASSGLGAVTSGLVRKQLAELMRKFKFMGNDWVDVARVTPRIRYEMPAGTPSSMQAAAGSAAAASAQQSSSQYDIDWDVELGKGIGEKVYSSLQVLTFGENSRESVVVAAGETCTVQTYGVRLGLEYQVNAYRTVSVFGNFGCDDNLDPVANPGPSDWAAPNMSYAVQLRNTIPTDNYSPALARKRRWAERTDP
jgi:hypothetical protein